MAFDGECSVKAEVSLFGVFHDYEPAAQVTPELPDGARVSDLRSAHSSHGRTHWLQGWAAAALGLRQRKLHSSRCGRSAGGWKNGVVATGVRRLSVPRHYCAIVDTAQARLDPMRALDFVSDPGFGGFNMFVDRVRALNHGRVVTGVSYDDDVTRCPAASNVSMRLCLHPMSRKPR